MEQKLIKIKKRLHDRPDGTIGIKREMIVYSILPDGTKNPVGYYESYVIKSREELNASERRPA